jgi:hypothetical protein
MRRFLFALSGFLLWLTVSLYALSTDAFTGTGALAGTWTVQQGDPARDTDVVRGNAANENTAFNTNETWNDNQYSQAVIKTTAGDTNAGVTVRASATGGSSVYYLLAAGASGGNSGKLYSVSGTTYTEIVDWNTDYATDDVVKLQAVGTTLTGYKNGSPIGSTTNGTLSSGSPGIYLFVGSATSLDDWEGASVVGGACHRLLLQVGC